MKPCIRNDGAGFYCRYEIKNIDNVLTNIILCAMVKKEFMKLKRKGL